MFRFNGRLPRRVALSAVVALTLAACASSDVSKISGASPEEIGEIDVSDIDLAVETANPNQALLTRLGYELRKATDLCATGSRPHGMKVTVTEFEEQDPATAFLIGDSIELAGRVELFDEATGAQTGAYVVTRSFSAMGIHGAIVMSDAEARLSEDFAASVCEEVFGRELEDKS